MPTIVYIDKATASDLVTIVDDRIDFIENHLHRNPKVLGEELKRLKSFFKVIEAISCQKEINE